MDISNLKIQDVWNVEQEILDVVHEICVKNNLKYSLTYGTLLGAVRHKGFIPWDDDIDIMMPREDYEKLLQIWKNVAPKQYIIQDYNTNDDYTNNFAKVRKNNTTFLQLEEEREKKYHKGIFIDIFPGDRVAQGKIRRTIQYFCSAVNLLYSRGYKSGSKGLIGIVESVLLHTKKEKYGKRRIKAEKYIKFWNKNINSEYFFACTIGDCKRYYPADLFDSIQMIEFNGKKYCVTGKAEEFLKIRYGNYMELPPKSEQVWKHHPLVVDFERNYEEL